ncbi:MULTISPECIES: TniQ family protein [unclassified Bacillus cereus group]|uniref:TniQ family protein n=1 Tax=unclassified Bacillus cereus group TaxID=2750818 RepID=UPI001F591FBA|nr:MULTISPECIES: TniQ family protein [unclassified Bacillus cereus group]
MGDFQYIYIRNFRNEKFSELYCLQPIALKTSYVESLTSYMSRLAYEHNILTGTLVNKILATNMDKKYLIKSAQRGGNRFYDGAKSINGYCKNALDCSLVLESLTLHNSLIDLTLIKWKNIVSLRGLLREYLSWCPNCIFDWRAEGSRIYYPLSWHLSSTQVCLIHNIYLSNICPHCNKQLPILHRSCINGYCPLCKRWLGEPQHTSGITNQDIFISKNIQELLTIDTTNLKIISQSLQKLIGEVTCGNIAEFARLMSIPKVTMWDWLKGGRLPSLEGLLKICLQLELSIGHLLTGNIKTLNYSVEKTKERIVIYSSNKTNRRREISSALLNKKLEGYTHSDETLSLSEISKRIGYDRKILYRHCPEQCKEIVENYKKYREKKSLKRKETVASRVQVAVEELMRNDIYPSRRSVEKRLGKPAVLREKYIQQVWKEIIHN